MTKHLIPSVLRVLVSVVSEAQDMTEILKPDKMSLNFENALTCTLTSPELAKRKNELQKAIFAKVKHVSEVDDGYVFQFDDDESLLPELFHYVLAEKQCCPFFQQDISIGSHASGITWKVSGAEGVKLILEQIMEEAIPNRE